MRVLYVGAHGQANNDDEGAIARSFQVLGVEVVRIRSLKSGSGPDPADFDFTLFHKIPVGQVKYISERGKAVCWFFDPLRKGFRSNDSYIDSIEPFLYRGFFTDGDYVEELQDSRIIDLKQGFDDLRIPYLLAPPKVKKDLLFIGTVGYPGYEKRTEHVRGLENRFGPSVAHTDYSIFKSDLTDICQSTRVMLAMPPVTNSYWSNRAYLLAGRGAFVLHPYSKGLSKQLRTGMVFYKNYQDLLKKIKYYTSPSQDSKRFLMQQEAQRLVANNHRYKDRVSDLIEACK